MLAVDTNVVIRYITADDPVQSPMARSIVDGGSILLLTTVALEAEWVLRSSYRYERRRVFEVLTSFAGLPSVTPQEPALLATALDWFRRGHDFADAIHLAGASDCQAFVTFDTNLAKRANGTRATPVRLL